MTPYPLAGHGVTSQVGMGRPACHAVVLWRAGGEVNGSGIGKSATANILDVHPPANVHGEIADAPRPCQATKTVGLDLDAGKDTGTPGQEMVPEFMQAFVQQHRLADLARHHGALFERLAGCSTHAIDETVFSTSRAVPGVQARLMSQAAPVNAIVAEGQETSETGTAR